MIVFIMALFLSAHANALDIKLARIQSDYTKKSYELFVEINERKLIHSIKTKNTKKNKTKTYPITVLDKPITLVKAAGISLVELSCTGFSTVKGCSIIIEYPSNITLGQFKKFHAKLEKKDSNWVLTHAEKVFTRLELKSRTILGLLIGIKEIVPHSK